MIVVTIASVDRASRIEEQHRHLQLIDGTIPHGVVTLGSQEFAIPGVEHIAHVEGIPFNLSRARNAAGDWAVAEADKNGTVGEIVFLDADCLPSVTLLDTYRDVLNHFPHSVASGMVTYLDRGAVTDPEELPLLRNPHPVRPDVAPGEIRRATAEEYNLFWSLNFALTSQSWKRVRSQFGGFDETFEGYGGEDTDFAWCLRHHRVPFLWAGGADAFHVWHPVSSPPWEHVEDIVKNARRFHAKWGEWPMQGWLEKFADRGMIHRTAHGWEMLR